MIIQSTLRALGAITLSSWFSMMVLWLRFISPGSFDQPIGSWGMIALSIGAFCLILIWLSYLQYSSGQQKFELAFAMSIGFLSVTPLIIYYSELAPGMSLTPLLLGMISTPILSLLGCCIGRAIYRLKHKRPRGFKPASMSHELHH